MSGKGNPQANWEREIANWEREVKELDQKAAQLRQKSETLKTAADTVNSACRNVYVRRSPGKLLCPTAQFIAKTKAEFAAADAQTAEDLARLRGEGLDEIQPK